MVNCAVLAPSCTATLADLPSSRWAVHAVLLFPHRYAVFSYTGKPGRDGGGEKFLPTGRHGLTVTSESTLLVTATRKHNRTTKAKRHNSSTQRLSHFRSLLGPARPGMKWLNCPEIRSKCRPRPNGSRTELLCIANTSHHKPPVHGDAPNASETSLKAL